MTIWLTLLIAAPYPTTGWDDADPIRAGMNETLLQQAETYAGGSGVIVRGGYRIYAWGNQSTRYDLKSTTKSIGVTALGLAIDDGLVGLDDFADTLMADFGTTPASNVDTGWLPTITLWHLATHTSGFDKAGGFEPLLFAPGAEWSYSDGGANWIADCLTTVYAQDLNELLFTRVFTPLGITTADLTWRSNAYRGATLAGVARREFGSGISANVDAMARIGYLYLRGGNWEGTQILPESFVAAVSDQPTEGISVRDAASYFDASDHYGLLWWTNENGAMPSVPRDTFFSWGLYDSVIVVIPSLDLVVARAGSGWRAGWTPDYSVLESFLGPIVASVNDGAPYPNSPVLSSLVWAAGIGRQPTDCDNWPTTWADDGHLYTSWGDGHGWNEDYSAKLSLGFSRVEGPADSFQGYDIRSPTGERTGDGPSGKKGSGMLMVDSVLYMWVRNAGNSEIAYSSDYAETWTWPGSVFTTSFGFPTPINYGQNYAGAPDGGAFVYIVSHDNPSAYDPADSMLLARVPSDSIADVTSYSYFAGMNGADPIWDPSVANRQPVFENPGGCRRSGISFNAALGRYIWWQGLPHSGDERYEGGFGVYDAPQPWGPWTTLYYIDLWDVGPGESGNFPPKWMSGDGTAMHLVFSGNDNFSVRRADVTALGVPVVGDTTAPAAPTGLTVY